MPGALSANRGLCRSAAMPRLSTADAVIESLIRHGIDTLYALPGVHNDHLFDAAPSRAGPVPRAASAA